jgi:thiamine biosynthesis lipoprotein
MMVMGIENGMVNAGGDLTIWGMNVDQSKWKIGIADPDKKTEFIAWLELTDISIVTSGNYEKYLEINGKKYTHIINPLTGYPVEGIKSVTLISPDAELSDALATSVFVMGVNDGLALVNQLKNVECLIIDEAGKYWQSKGLDIHFY